MRSRRSCSRQYAERIGLLKKLRSAVGSPDKRLLEEGILARGRILECDPTGLSSGNPSSPTGPKQVCEVRVEISGVPGRAPYEASCRHAIPRIYIPQMQTTGAAVAVRVDPADPQSITLDLTTDPPPEQSRGAAAQPQVMTPEADMAQPQVTTQAAGMGAAEILAKGSPCRVVIVESMPLGQADSQGRDAIGFVLSVFVEGRTPFQAQIGVGLPPEAMPLVFPGANLPAKIVSGRDDLVSIDWEAALEESKHGPPIGP